MTYRENSNANYSTGSALSGFREYANLLLEASMSPCPSPEPPPPVLSFISGPCWGLSTYRKMLYAPWEQGQTMGDIGTLDALTPTLLYSCGIFLDYYAPRIQMTSNYVFLYVEPTSSDVFIKRYSVTDSSLVEYHADIPTEHYTYDSAVYSDDVIYTLETDMVSTPVMQLKRVDFSSGVATATLIEEWSKEINIDGIDYESWDNYFFGRVKYGTYDCIVNIMTYIGDSPQLYLIKVVIYNINTNTFNEQWVLPSTDMDADINDIYYQSTSPSFYQTKIIFTFTAEVPSGFPGPPYGSHCLLPTFIIDISDNSVTRIDDHKYDFDVDYPYVTTYAVTSTVNPTTGMYYFTAYYQPQVGVSGTHIFSMDIDDPHVVMGDTCSNELECHQAANEGYAVDNTGGVGTRNIIEIPSETVVTTVDVLLGTSNTVNESLAAIDIDNSMIWNIKSDVLQGKSLIGGTDKDITVNWVGATIPFSYPSYREVWIRILDGKCVVMIYSRSSSSPYSYQQDFYLLKETI